MKNHFFSSMFGILCMCFVPAPGLTCTTFVLDNNGQPVYGKNMESAPVSAFVLVNKRGVEKISVRPPQEPDAEQFVWISKFGSVTFNMFARELPFEGINETGLFISTMGLFHDTEYPTPDSRPPVDGSQWVQYQLDNFSTVDEVIASDQKFRIQAPKGKHYLVGDSQGNCASIEFLDGKLVCHTGQAMPFKVMVGASGTYDQSVAFIKLFKGFGGFLPIFHPGFFRPSLLRFVIAADKLQQYSPQESGPAVDYAFDILQQVETQPLKNSAVWSSVYDSANKQIHFRSWNNDRIRSFNLNAFDFSCTTPVKTLDLSADLSGDVSNTFIDYTREIDLEMLTQWDLTDADTAYLAAYPDTTTCTEK
jgi:choloylglycine hydrolase